MTTRTIEKLTEQQLRERVIQAWQAGHGGSAEEVYLLRGEDSLALIIPKAMYQAEIVLFKNTTNNTKILDQYLRSILEIISDEIQSDIEAYAGKRIQEMTPLIDLKAGYISALYRF